MRSKRTFYRTIIQVEVLSEDAFHPHSLTQVDRAITSDDCSGDWNVTERQEVDGPTMARLLREQGSDPCFLGLTEEGEDIDEDEEEESEEED